MTGRFVIEGRLPGLNEIVNAARANKFAGASQKKKETRRCQWAVIAGRVPVFTTPVRVGFRWIEPNLRRDPDNVAAGSKFALDALVELARIPGDSRKWILGITHEFPEADAKEPRVEVEITDEPLEA